MKKISLIFLIIILLFLIKNTIFSIFDTLKNGKVSNSLQTQLVSEQKKNKFLKERLFYVKTDNFVEDEARRKLGMVRVGEHTVIVPSEPEKDSKPIEIDTRPNWEKWLKLFF